MWRPKHHEFWNSHVFHLPVYIYWLWLSLKARSPFFFSAANPVIETGGLLGESKIDILNRIDRVYIPETIYYSTAPTLEKVLYDINARNIRFPFVLKPDIGQGGWLAEVIYNQQQLARYLSMIRMPFLLQEFIAEPEEYGLLYYRMPGAVGGVISSLAVKKFLSVTGDGVSSVWELMQRDERARPQISRVKGNAVIDLLWVPARGEVIRLSEIGNHSYGTTFHDARNLIDSQLTAKMDEICSRIDGFYFGRFDIKCRDEQALKSGDFKILELNGVGSEPLHIFDPGISVMSAYRDALRHWGIIYEISKCNVSRYPYMKLTDALKYFRNFVRFQRMHSQRLTIGN
ncbi:MAG TPA: hypothetical protein VD927_05025 [Chryseosolibacter sp.]|nr:hypothetical protein [Chryseosolibacter sp.]